MQQWSKVLLQTGLFRSLATDPDGLHALEGRFEYLKFNPGDKIIVEGTVGDAVFILLSGELSVYKKTTAGDSYKVAILSSEHHPTFGEGGLVESESRSATVVCDKQAECLSLTRSDLEEFSRILPRTGLLIYKELCQTILMRLQKTSDDLLMLHRALVDEVRG